MLQSITQWFLIKIGLVVLKLFDYLVTIFANNQEVYGADEIEFDALLKDSLPDIYAEYMHLRGSNLLLNVQDFYKVETDIGQDEDWKVYPFILYNHFFDENLKQCPKTAKVLKEIPACTSAMFSTLYPRKHIYPHKGLYKGVIRVLFTLEAPKHGQAWIRVGQEKFVFQEGQSIYFDETFEHEVKNESEENRVVLYMDIYRDLPLPLNILNQFIFRLLQKSPFIAKKVSEYQETANTGVDHKATLQGYQF